MSNTWGNDAGGSGSIEDSGEAQGGGGSGTLSRLIIKVPGYDGAEATSYLRLGAVPTATASLPEPGTALADLVPAADAFIDDTRDRDGAGGTTDQGGGHGLTVAQRKAESARLHTKGGWRDHSDGNRITTTKGDKVEVIRGNYKLLVLGRQDASDNGVMVDFSGGLAQDDDVAPGAISKIEWKRDSYDGTWKVTEEAEKGDQKTVYHGDVEEYFYGRKKFEQVGSEVASPIALIGGSEATSLKENPIITEKTWAKSITSSTGSEANRVATMTETTYATTMTASTDCHMTTENMKADIMLATTKAGFIAEGTVCGLKVEAYAGAVIEAYTGLKLELSLAGKIEISGPFSLGLSFGYSGDFHNLKDEMGLLENRVEVTENKITANTNAIAANTTKIGAAETAIAANKTALASTEQKLHATKVNLGMLKTQLMNAHILT